MSASVAQMRASIVRFIIMGVMSAHAAVGGVPANCVNQI
jgi:hypothetical protein